MRLPASKENTHHPLSIVEKPAGYNGWAFIDSIFDVEKARQIVWWLHNMVSILSIPISLLHRQQQRTADYIYVEVAYRRFRTSSRTSVVVFLPPRSGVTMPAARVASTAA